MKKAVPAITDQINIFELAGKLLRAKSEKIEELEVHCFEDEGDAHDESVWTRIHLEFIDHARQLQVEMETGSAPFETGESEDDRIPVNGVLYYAIQRFGWKYLYLAVSHEDTELPVYLLIGTVKIEH